MGRYIYPAIFKEEKNGGYSVRFPDLAGCCAGGYDLHSATLDANDVLSLALYTMEQNGDVIPQASSKEDVSAMPYEFVTYIGCDTARYDSKPMPEIIGDAE